MTSGTTRVRRRLTMLFAVPVAVAAAALGFGHPMPALAASSSTQVGYLTDATNGGFSLWVDAFGITAPVDGGTYATKAPPAASATVTIHNITMTALDVPSSTALSALDTLVMFATCDIGGHPNAMKAVNAFVDGGGKLIILDGAQCTDSQGGVADYSTFIKPFTSNFLDPVPQQLASTPFSFVGETGSNLTKGFPDCTTGATGGCEAGNAVADASVLSPNSPGWCTALAGTTNNGTSGVKGPVMGYTRSPSGKGFIAYSGEAFAWSVPTTQNKAHLRLVFDDMLTQAWNLDGLSCARAAKSLTLAPASDVKSVGNQEQLSATVTDGGNPVAGVVVTFNVTAGPNLGIAALTGTTDATGVATASYGSTKTGTDTWSATFSDTDDHVSNPSKVSWTPPVGVAETHYAIFLPLIGLVLAGGLFALTLVRRRRVVTA